MACQKQASTGPYSISGGTLPQTWGGSQQIFFRCSSEYRATRSPPQHVFVLAVFVARQHPRFL